MFVPSTSPALHSESGSAELGRLAFQLRLVLLIVACSSFKLTLALLQVLQLALLRALLLQHLHRILQFSTCSSGTGVLELRVERTGKGSFSGPDPAAVAVCLRLERQAYDDVSAASLAH